MIIIFAEQPIDLVLGIRGLSRVNMLNRQRSGLNLYVNIGYESQSKR